MPIAVTACLSAARATTPRASGRQEGAIRAMPAVGKVSSTPSVAFVKSVASVRRVPSQSARATSLTCSAQAMKVLMMGGTRFIGKYVARMLVEQGHDVTLFTRGKTPVTERIPDDTNISYENFKRKVKHIAGNRNDYADMKSKLAGQYFDVVMDINAREGEQVQAVIDACPLLSQYIFCSSAGVYLKSDQMPHMEGDAVDPECRHKGKLDSEQVLARSGVRWTSIRPVYIYGPLNYNPVEEYFFHRIAANRPICIPGSGMQLTQMGHVKDLAVAFVKCMNNPNAYNQVYNISGERSVTWDGLAKACAEAAGKPAPKIVRYNAKEFKGKFPEKKKAFPFRDQHFFADVTKAMVDLDWKPEFDLVDGLRDSWNKDYSKGRYCEKPDFECDDIVLKGVKVAAGV